MRSLYGPWSRRASLSGTFLWNLGLLRTLNSPLGDFQELSADLAHAFGKERRWARFCIQNIRQKNFQVLMYAKVDSILNLKIGTAEQIRKLQARALTGARHLIESVDEMKRNLLIFFRKLQWEYVVRLILLRWNQAMLHWYIGIFGVGGYVVWAETVKVVVHSAFLNWDVKNKKDNIWNEHNRKFAWWFFGEWGREVVLEEY